MDVSEVPEEGSNMPLLHVPCRKSKKKKKKEDVTLTIYRLLFVHQVEGISSRRVGQIQSLSHLSERPPEAFSVAYSLARLQSEPLT